MAREKLNIVRELRPNFQVQDTTSRSLLIGLQKQHVFIATNNFKR